MMREDDDIENMGIMQGFMDSMDDEGDDEGEGEDPEMMMERRPDSPEILMNNLRGDMRSVDARRDELADLVGYQAATETPEQCLQCCSLSWHSRAVAVLARFLNHKTWPKGHSPR
jgi:hypothetical protein